MNALFATRLLGWKLSSKNKLNWPMVPNCADVDNATSLRLAARMLDNLGVKRGTVSQVPRDPGGPLEQLVADSLSADLPRMDDGRSWSIQPSKIITDFYQYEHLKDVDRLVVLHPELKTTLGRDYLIKPDVTVGLVNRHITNRGPFLHAAISCKWTIRSDRVQNIRHEFNQMIRHRRGRQPHLVTVTAEPLPSRLASIARGTGEVDAVYHIALAALAGAVEECDSKDQVEAWDEAISQGRLLGYETLAETLARW